MGTVADVEATCVHAMLLQACDLVKEDVRVHHHAVSNDTGNVGPEDAAGNEVEGELTLVVDDRVAGVVATRVADHVLAILSQEVHNLPFSLVSPLTADHGISRHSNSLHKDSSESSEQRSQLYQRRHGN